MYRLLTVKAVSVQTRFAQHPPAKTAFEMATRRILTAVVPAQPAHPASNVAMWRIATVAYAPMASALSLLAMMACETAQRQTEIAVVIVSLAPWTSPVLVPMIVKVVSVVRPFVGRPPVVMVFKMAMRRA